MAARVSEAIVLRTYPFRESDLIVSFFTRDQGKLRGTAYRARKPKGGFGAALERLSHVRIAFTQRENRELVTFDRCELIDSTFAFAGDYTAMLALDYFSEVAEQVLPEGEANERFFRLFLSVLAHLRGAGPGQMESRAAQALAYFSYWAVRLSGFLPALHVCAGCGCWLDDPELAPEQRPSFFFPGRSGLVCDDCRRALGMRAGMLSFESRQAAVRFAREPVEAFAPEAWTRSTAADLRRYLAGLIEEHIERRLVTAAALESI